MIPEINITINITVLYIEPEQSFSAKSNKQCDCIVCYAFKHKQNELYLAFKWFCTELSLSYLLRTSIQLYFQLSKYNLYSGIVSFVLFALHHSRFVA